MPGSRRRPHWPAGTLRRAVRLGLDTLLPPLCPGCEVDLVGPRWICGPCRRALRPVPDRWVCWICRGEEEERGRDAGLSCGNPDHRAEWGRAAFWMESPLDAVVHALKYRNRPDLGRPLGRLLACRLRLEVDLVTAVPLHRTRLRERTYNQAGHLARAASIRWGAPFVGELLVRSRGTRAQARLTRAHRAGNVAEAFRCPQPGWAQGCAIAVVDDVATTGSTIRAAAAPLLAAGASRVVPVVLALA